MATRRTPAAPDLSEPPQGRLATLRFAYSFTRERDRRLPLVLLACLLVPIAVLLGLGFAVGHPVSLGVLGLAVGFLATMAVFTRRSQRAQYAEVADRPGVAASIVENMRTSPYRVTPAVQVNRDQAMVHRAVGRAGVVLLAEGRTSGTLVATEQRRLSKVLGDTPVTVISVGNGPDQVPLDKLQAKMMRLPRTLSKAQVDAVDRRIKALPGTGTGGGMPIPKGPLPTRVSRRSLRG